MQKPQGLQRKTPMKRGTTPLRRGKPLKADPAKGLKADPSKGLKRTAFRTSPEKMREQRERERARAQERAKGKAQERRQDASLAQRTPLVRKKPLTTSPSSAKSKAPAKPRKRPSRPAVTAEEKACRQVVSERSEGMCEKCGRPGPLEKAHRIARSQGGRWDASNVLDLCHDCHHGNHGEPKVAYDHGWHLRGHVEDTTGARVLLRKGWSVGWALLDDQGGYEWVDGPEWDDNLLAPSY